MFNPNQTTNLFTDQITKCASQTDLPVTPSPYAAQFSSKFSNKTKFDFEPIDLTDSAISTCNDADLMTDSNSSNYQKFNSIFPTVNISSNSTTNFSFPSSNEISPPENSSSSIQSVQNLQLQPAQQAQPAFALAPVPIKKQKSKFSRKNRPANLSIPTKISAFADSLESMTPPPAITSKSSQSTASQITENLILGSECDAANPEIYKKFNITKVLTIMSDNFILPESIQSELGKTINHKFIKLNDTTCSDISTYFREAIEFMEGDGITLVHCRAGISRSSTLIMAYLIEKNSWSLNEAFTFTKSKRGCVAPNFGFLGQLQKFEDDLKSRMR